MTLDTSHSPMGPCGQAEQSPVWDSWTYCSTASCSSSVDFGEKAERVVVHIARDIDPDDPANMSVFVACELTQVGPQSFFLKDFAL